MILIPLAVTAQLLHANVWEYMAFGAAWSAWLCLIHSEVHHPWDGLFRLLGLGTAGDHHVHHRTFIFNVRNLAQPRPPARLRTRAEHSCLHVTPHTRAPFVQSLLLSRASASDVRSMGIR